MNTYEIYVNGERIVIYGDTLVEALKDFRERNGGC